MNLALVGHRYAFYPSCLVLIPRSGQDGGEVWGVFAGFERLLLPSRGVGVISCHDGDVLKVEALAGSYTTPGSFRNIRGPSAAVTLLAGAFEVVVSRFVRWAGIHCPSRSLWARAVATRRSSGMSGSSSQVSGMSPVQTVPGAT